MKKIWIPLVIVLLLALGWWFYNKKKKEAEGGEGTADANAKTAGDAALPESHGGGIGGGGGGGGFPAGAPMISTPVTVAPGAPPPKVIGGPISGIGAQIRDTRAAIQAQIDKANSAAAASLAQQQATATRPGTTPPVNSVPVTSTPIVQRGWPLQRISPPRPLTAGR